LGVITKWLAMSLHHQAAGTPCDHVIRERMREHAG